MINRHRVLRTLRDPVMFTGVTWRGIRDQSLDPQGMTSSLRRANGPFVPSPFLNCYLNGNNF
ncbi:MAG: hypothetical protein V7606_27 [Burkholderiales bacterium]